MPNVYQVVGSNPATTSGTNDQTKQKSLVRAQTFQRRITSNVAFYSTTLTLMTLRDTFNSEQMTSPVLQQNFLITFAICRNLLSIGLGKLRRGDNLVSHSNHPAEVLAERDVVGVDEEVVRHERYDLAGRRHSKKAERLGLVLSGLTNLNKRNEIENYLNVIAWTYRTEIFYDIQRIRRVSVEPQTKW